ncbi:sensor histidine kinase KdpD [Arthrobacter sp. SDTb3-6]|uniref:sensor histidine kinase n=1 Tax=Arthrobacter sp. SDTb3-6 TaxID=2713571 RepID=UPI00159E81E0|nr:HAMP domain-containing sensor histidine kinase [Arthrobacter sp. SDTb3-6]NVN00518.1 HAMP domain-containing histidine kinase [Arthrobacter sp. SDTb3-6]
MNSRDQFELKRAVLWLALQFTTVIIVLLVLVGALIYAIVAASAQEAGSKVLTGATLIDSPADAPLGAFVAISTGGQLLLSRKVPDGLPDTAAMVRVATTQQDETDTVKAGGRSYSVLTTYRNGRVIQAAIDQHESEEELNRLMLAMTIAVAVSAALAAGLSVLMARRAMRPMAESLALQRRFVADASHELRTPLTLLSTRAQLLRRKLESGTSKPSEREVAAGVASLVEDAKMLTGILEDLLLSADPRETVGHDLLNLVTIADSAASLAEPEALQRAIQLRRSGSSEPVNVRGSEVALRRVFTALIANALDHAETNVEVEVAVHARDAVICVRDDGPGFAPGTQLRVFDRFASARRLPGRPDGMRHYGLGLALVAEIVALHEGKIMVEPGPPAGGAVIKVLVPLAQP